MSSNSPKESPSPNGEQSTGNKSPKGRRSPSPPPPNAEPKEEVKKEEPVPEEDAKRKTFVTQKEEGGKEWAVAEYKTTYTLHDMIIPGGKAAKLVNITDPYSKELRMTEILNRLKFKDPLPVIILIGAATDRAAKALAGLVRAAHHTDAIILDSGLHSGIEKFCLRKDVKLIGIAPESEVIYPRVNPTERLENELSNGHTHFMLIGDRKNEYKWGDEAEIKIDLAKRLAMGRYSESPCKVVGVLIGDNDQGAEKELQIVVCKDNNWPILLVEGSKFADGMIRYKNDISPNIEHIPSLKAFMDQANTFVVKENSEDLASITHLALTITL